MDELSYLKTVNEKENLRLVRAVHHPVHTPWISVIPTYFSVRHLFFTYCILSVYNPEAYSFHPLEGGLLERRTNWEGDYLIIRKIPDNFPKKVLRLWYYRITKCTIQQQVLNISGISTVWLVTLHVHQQLQCMKLTINGAKN